MSRSEPHPAPTCPHDDVSGGLWLVGEFGHDIDEFSAVEIIDIDAVKCELVSKLGVSTERANLCECSLT